MELMQQVHIDEYAFDTESLENMEEKEVEAMSAMNKREYYAKMAECDRFEACEVEQEFRDTVSSANFYHSGHKNWFLLVPAKLAMYRVCSPIINLNSASYDPIRVKSEGIK